MIYSLVVKPDAEDDILNASLWYKEQQDGLGNVFCCL